ncbi:helix-turn-helix transcriptional regulator [Myxococcus sp. AM011]|uniref:helix-turn-helix domain-containing protein n=1 Tax=Myxococcus sp. AM011 TaxID=2745200 RepID=UPI001595456C|nr:helix-turn-helix transcriptional regulator [Myxococcus sp. AM011]NVJ27614.1 helix-turn-helix transcriptional regulator [Myxococcus sp. AM011]
MYIRPLDKAPALSRPLGAPAPGPPLSSVIGAAARAARLRARLTQAEVANLTAISVTVYNRLERGRMQPSVPTLHRLCAVLGVSPNELLGYPHSLPLEGESARNQLLHRVHHLDERQAQALLQLLPILR